VEASGQLPSLPPPLKSGPAATDNETRQERVNPPYIETLPVSRSEKIKSQSSAASSC